MVKLPLSSTPTPPREPYCKTSVWSTALPVLEIGCRPIHWLELSPPPSMMIPWLEAPLCTSCSLSWLTSLLLSPLLLFAHQGLLLLLSLAHQGLLLSARQGLLLWRRPSAKAGRASADTTITTSTANSRNFFNLLPPPPEG